MKIQVLSDIHAECFKYGSSQFVDYVSKNADDVDVLVLAGDICVVSYPQTTSILEKFSSLYKNVVWILGNHEYYRGEPSEVLDAAREIEGKITNLSLLDNQIKVIDRVRFVGSTMWFPKSDNTETFKHCLNDFRVIKGFDEWVYNHSEVSQKFLKKNVKGGDVVITHHLPSSVSISPMYYNSVTNCFFVCDMEELIVDRQPAYWIHGHTHQGVDQFINNTRIVANPFGYAGHQENQMFDEGLVLTI